MGYSYTYFALIASPKNSNRSESTVKAASNRQWPWILIKLKFIGPTVCRTKRYWTKVKCPVCGGLEEFEEEFRAPFSAYWQKKQKGEKIRALKYCIRVVYKRENSWYSLWKVSSWDAFCHDWRQRAGDQLWMYTVYCLLQTWYRKYSF
jgi:hypothetical protein